MTHRNDHSNSESVLQSRGVYLVESRDTQTCKTEAARFQQYFGLLQERAKHRMDHRDNTALQNQLRQSKVFVKTLCIMITIMRRRIVIIAVRINLIIMQANLRMKDEELRK